MILAELGIRDASWLELAWTAIASTGALFALLNVADARIDLGVVEHERRNGPAKAIFAWGSIVTESIRVLIHTVFVTIGVLAMLLAEPPAQQLPTKIRVFTLVFKWGLLSVAILATSQSVVLWWMRQRLRLEFQRKLLTRLSDRSGE